MTAPDPDALVAEWTERFDSLRAQVNEIHTTAQVIEELDDELIATTARGKRLLPRQRASPDVRDDAISPRAKTG
jgi:hypothetical protein